MSKYTTQLRYICETLAGYTESKGLSQADAIIAAARPQLFNFSYPITDTTYKEVLETKIIKHYYMREIGLETVGLFRFYLNEKMNLIMPYYDELYKSAALEFNPFLDVNYTVTHEGEKEEDTDKTITGSGTESGTNTGTVQDSGTESGTNTGTVTDAGTESGTNTGTVQDSGTGDSWQYNSDTPQGGLSGLTNNNYLSEATHQTATDGNTNTRNLADSREKSNTNTRNLADSRTKSNTNTRNLADSRTRSESTHDVGSLASTDSYINSISGKMGTTSYSNLLLEYRKTLLNIDALIISELSDLFMNIY